VTLPKGHQGGAKTEMRADGLSGESERGAKTLACASRIIAGEMRVALFDQRDCGHGRGRN
jgi:hypothetical protein